MCEECDKEFLDSYLLKKFKKCVCDECKFVEIIALLLVNVTKFFVLTVLKHA